MSRLTVLTLYAGKRDYLACGHEHESMQKAVACFVEKQAQTGVQSLKIERVEGHGDTWNEPLDRRQRQQFAEELARQMRPAAPSASEARRRARNESFDASGEHHEEGRPDV